MKQTELYLCECDLSNIVDKKTLEKCIQIQRRKDQRKMKEAKEKKEEAKCNARESNIEKKKLEAEISFTRMMHAMPKLGQTSDEDDAREEKILAEKFSTSPQNFANVAKFGFGVSDDFPTLGESKTMTTTTLPARQQQKVWGKISLLHNNGIDMDAAFKEMNSDKKKKKTNLFCSRIERVERHKT